MALVLMLGGAALLVTGCGGFSQSSATPGTYVIQVTGTGASSNLSRYQNVTLVISAK
jgi:ABC-type glycerol-3-phosphate transport system substrate-binding protein